jgi:predicted CoA-binding protein
VTPGTEGRKREESMPSLHETFWENEKFALVGRSEVKPFPTLSYAALKKAAGKTVFAVDPSADEIEGDPAFKDLASLPEPVDAVVLEVPKEETAQWVQQAADAGITEVWIHMGRETPEALSLAEEKGLEVRTGTCAVQYLDTSFPHNIHKFFRKLTGKW